MREAFQRLRATQSTHPKRGEYLPHHIQHFVVLCRLERADGLIGFLTVRDGDERNGNRLLDEPEERAEFGLVAARGSGGADERVLAIEPIRNLMMLRALLPKKNAVFRGDRHELRAAMGIDLLGETARGAPDALQIGPQGDGRMALDFVTSMPHA